MREADPLAPLALLLVGDKAPVALRPHRPGADHHRVEAGPQAGQHLGVGVGADRAGDAADRRPPVDRRGEVHRDEGPVLPRLLPWPVGVELLLDAWSARDRASGAASVAAY